MRKFEEFLLKTEKKRRKRDLVKNFFDENRKTFLFLQKQFTLLKRSKILSTSENNRIKEVTDEAARIRKIL